MKRHRILFVIVLTVLPATIRCDQKAAHPKPSRENTAPSPHRGCAPADRVVDGDTAYIGGVRMRLARIDAPKNNTPNGREAEAWLRSTIEGKDVYYSWSKRGYYKRPLVTIWLKQEHVGQWGESINQAMIDEGLATVYRPPVRRSSGRRQEGR